MSNEEDFLDEVLRLLGNNDGRIYISCMGEEGYPNVSVRKVNINAEFHQLTYIDDGVSRSVQLMQKNPKVIVNVLHQEDPYHGFKIKGRTEFQPYSFNDNDNQVKKSMGKALYVTIYLEEVFPY